MISLRTHNIIDYFAGVALLLAPFIFGFAELEAGRNAFMFSGFFLIMYSLLTNYYFAVLRVIPLGAHMTLDTLTGVFLIVSPWVFSYQTFLTPTQEYLHYIVGVGVFALVGFTRERTEADKRVHGIYIDPQAPLAGHA
ncbi:MAG TPA: hypothetical protein PKC28_04520 [Bdellovibrionales bacterium]|nr:hypothetical protein [Bdellovibrionales bacterium]